MRRGTNIMSVPKSVGAGRVLCHNHVLHTVDTPSAERGFRGWTDLKPPQNFVKCPCGWSGLPHYARRDHVKYVKSDEGRARIRRLAGRLFED